MLTKAFVGESKLVNGLDLISHAKMEKLWKRQKCFKMEKCLKMDYKIKTLIKIF